MLAFARHAELRARTLRWGVVRNPSLPRLGLALAAWRSPAAAGRRCCSRSPTAATSRVRCRHFGAGPLQAPGYVAADLAAAWTSLRGSARHRRLVL